MTVIITLKILLLRSLYVNQLQHTKLIEGATMPPPHQMLVSFCLFCVTYISLQDVTERKTKIM